MTENWVNAKIYVLVEAEVAVTMMIMTFLLNLNHLHPMVKSGVRDTVRVKS